MKYLVCLFGVPFLDSHLNSMTPPRILVIQLSELEDVRHGWSTGTLQTLASYFIQLSRTAHGWCKKTVIVVGSVLFGWICPHTMQFILVAHFIGKCCVQNTDHFYRAPDLHIWRLITVRLSSHLLISDLWNVKILRDFRIIQQFRSTITGFAFNFFSD